MDSTAGAPHTCIGINHLQIFMEAQRRGREAQEVIRRSSKVELRAQLLGFDFLCSEHFVIIADRSRTRRSSGNS